jgi:hypothetical protein
MLTVERRAARINIAHYQTLLIKKHEGYLDIEVSPYISRAGEILSDAMESTVLAMASFSANNKAQSPPLSLWVKPFFVVFFIPSSFGICI